MKLTDFVLTGAILPELKATDRDGAIGELIDALLAAGAADPSLRDDLLKAILEREKNGSTGFGKGVAVPHVKHEKITQMAAGIAISQNGVDFNALDKAPVYSIFMLLSPKDAPDEHLQAMEKIFSNLQNDTFRRFLRQSNTVEQVVDLLEDADADRIN